MNRDTVRHLSRGRKVSALLAATTMACLSAGQLPAGEEYRKEPVAAKVQGHVDSKPLTEMLSAYKTKPSLQNAALLLEGICGFSVKVEDGGLVFRYMTDSVGKENRISPVLARLGKERDAVIVGMLSTIVAAGEKVDRKDPDSCLGFSDEISSLVAYLRGQFRGNIQVDKASAVLTEAQLAEQTHDAAVFRLIRKICGWFWVLEGSLTGDIGRFANGRSS